MTVVPVMSTIEDDTVSEPVISKSLVVLNDEPVATNIPAVSAPADALGKKKSLQLTEAPLFEALINLSSD